MDCNLPFWFPILQLSIVFFLLTDCISPALCSLCCNHGEWKINQISWEPRSAPLAAGSLCIAVRKCYRGWLLSVTSSFVRNLSLNIFLKLKISADELNLNLWRTLDPNVTWHTLVLWFSGKKINQAFSEVSFLFSREPCLQRSDILLEYSGLLWSVQGITSHVPGQHQILNMFKLDNSRPPPLHSLFDHNLVIRYSPLSNLLSWAPPPACSAQPPQR